jgi:hypothetical protein
MDVSDSSEALGRGLRHEPSRGCLPLLRRGTSEVSRFPCRGHVQACRSLRPRKDAHGRAHSLDHGRVAFRLEDSVGSFICLVSRLNAPARLLCLLRFGARVTHDAARIGIPGGELFPGQDSFDFISVLMSSNSPAFLCRSPGAFPPPARPRRGGVRMERAGHARAACGRATSPKPVLAGAAAHDAAMVRRKADRRHLLRARGGRSAVGGVGTSLIACGLGRL